MHPSLRILLAVLAGVIVGATMMNVIESYSPYQPPDGATYTNGGWPYLTWVQKLPAYGWRIILGSLLSASLVGGFIAKKIAPLGLFPVSPVTGFALLFVPVGKYLGFASPDWVTYIAVIGCVVFGWLGGWLARLNFKTK